MIKWNLYLKALDNAYPISWVMLRLRLESDSRNLPMKINLAVIQRTSGYKRRKTIRQIGKRISLYKNAKRILLSRIPLTNY